MVEQESLPAVAARIVRAIEQADCPTLTELASAEIRLHVPGARDVDLTQDSIGVAALCLWTQTIREQCGHLRFHLHRFFENGCELMAVGELHIDRLPLHFDSHCAFHLVFEAGRLSSLQLLLDTFALERFRGRAD